MVRRLSRSWRVVANRVLQANIPTAVWDKQLKVFVNRVVPVNIVTVDQDKASHQHVKIASLGNMGMPEVDRQLKPRANHAEQGHTEVPLRVKHTALFVQFVERVVTV